MSSTVCLLVLLGVVMVFGSPLKGGDLAVSPAISKMLNLDAQEIGSKTLFSSVVNSINTSCQRKEDMVLLNATLDVYTRIFSSILQHGSGHHHASSLLEQVSKHDKKVVKETVKQLQAKMEALRGKLVSFNDNREDLLKKLNDIKVDDPKDQRRALAEYDTVLEVVSSIRS